MSEPADCVSDLVLDEWGSGELDPLTRDRTAQHVMACPSCRARHQQLERQRAEFYAAAPTFASHARRFVPQRAYARRARIRLAAGAVAAIAAALALAVFPSLQDTRLKGGPSLGYYVKRSGQVWTGDSSTTLQPGDLLRFTYSSERDCYLAVFDRDTRATQIFFPSTPVAAFVRAGVAVPLDFSVELDATPGAEHVHALFCDSSVELAPLRAALAETGTLPIPAGCRHDAFTLRKVAR